MCFRDTTPEECGFDYESNPKAWMNRQIFFAWLVRFDQYIGQTTGRRVILTIDNASSHGQPHILLELHNTEIAFPPKNTTSRLRPCDAGIIASVKRRFRRRQIQRAVDLLDLGITEGVYDIDLKMAIPMIYDIWHRLEGSIIINCWTAASLIGQTKFNSLTSTYGNIVNHDETMPGIEFETSFDGEDLVHSVE